MTKLNVYTFAKRFDLSLPYADCFGLSNAHGALFQSLVASPIKVCWDLGSLKFSDVTLRVILVAKECSIFAIFSG